MWLRVIITTKATESVEQKVLVSRVSIYKIRTLFKISFKRSTNGMMDWWAFQTLYFTFLENKFLIQGKEKRFSCLPGFEQAGATCILSSVASNLTCIIQICYWPIGHCSKSTSMTQKVPVSSRLLGRTFVACHLVSGVYSNKKHYYSMSFFLPFNWPRVHTWPANNCLQIMVCSCLVPSKCVLLQIIFCSCVIGTTFWREKWQVASLNCQELIKNNMKTNLVIEW